MNRELNPRFTWTEFSGALGDLGLFIPLVVGMTIACDLNIGIILIFAGLMNILTGLLFKQPIPVQPMKAIATVAITEGFLKTELMASGILMGLLILGLSTIIEPVNRIIPKAIVRGIQLGVGIKLALKGFMWIKGLPFFGLDSIFLGLIIIVLLSMKFIKIKAILLYIFLAGFFILYLKQPHIYNGMSIKFPDFHFMMPSLVDWKVGLLRGALPQLPLTILNSVIAVCALSEKYFPKKGISSKRMAVSVGIMNLICVPFGAIPMCHGAGGLAAQYRFGARTGGSVIMLGIIKLSAGLFFGSALLILLQSYPKAILGAMLIFAGIELAKSAKGVVNQKIDWAILLVTAGFIVGINTLAGFLAGCSVAIMGIVFRKIVSPFEKGG